MASSHSHLSEPDLTDSEFADASGVAIAPETAPDYSIPPTKLEQLKASKWRPTAVFAGAILVGGLLIPLVIGQNNAPTTTAATASWELALPASSTMMTELSAAPGQPLKGQISAVADITGKAPVGGAVARWVVQPGASVQAGQPVVRISSGAASAAPLPGESRQIEAENQQTAAADDQLELANRLTTTQQKLAAAQQRVERAQENIAKTRAIIAQMRAGGDAPALPAPAPAPRRKKAKTSVKNDPKVAAARAAVGEAQSAFDATKAQLSTARADLSAAQKSLAPLQSRLNETQANVKVTEGKWDQSAASASDLQAARSARDNAKDTLKSATDRLFSAQQSIPDLEAKLVTRERALEDAKRAQRAAIANANASANAQDDEPEVAPTAPTATSSDNAMSVEQAAKLVDDALAESRAATREADRLRKLIDTYQAQAQKSNQRITNATEKLQNAQRNSQERMVQSVPRVRFTAARAPASGVVVWIATLAREVGAGQSVFGMSSGQTYRARFEDKTDGWKNARVGQVVNALLAPPAAPAPVPVATVKAPSADDAGSPPMPVLVSPAPNNANAATPNAPAVAAVATPTPELDANNAAAQGAVPVKVRLTRIAPPESAGKPAILEGELVSGSAAAGPNYRLLASLPSVGAPNILAIPDSALVERNGAWLVAVIEPDAAPQPQVTPAATAAATPAATPDATDAGTLAWRVVKVGEGDGISRRVNDGLKAGERIVTDPLPLIAQAPPEATAMPRVKLS